MAETAPTGMLKPADLPAPDTLIDYGDGSFGPVMWHFAGEGELPILIAEEQGFELHGVKMEEALSPDDPVWRAYFEDGADASEVLPRWTPPIQDGWRLIAKHEAEHGPVAIYARPKAGEEAR